MKGTGITMNESTNATRLSDATEAELIEAIGALWAKDYLANNELTGVAEYVHDVNQGDGDMFEEDNREAQQDLWQAVHEEFFAWLAAYPAVAAEVARLEAEAAANRPAIDWPTRLEHARSELAKAAEDLIKYPNDKGQVHRVANCLAFLRSEEARAAADANDNDEVEF